MNTISLYHLANIEEYIERKKPGQKTNLKSMENNFPFEYHLQ
jgi:hypothetical protein